MGVRDALEQEMPRAYLDKVIRKFIPDVEEDTVAKFAQKQASFFDETAESL